MTKTDLSKARFSDLRIMFYGSHNLKIPPEVPIIQNPAETLAYVFGAGLLKKSNKHLNLPRNFFMLVSYINWFSYNNGGFASIAHNLKKCFDDSPGKQKERHGLLIQDAREEFVNYFFELYKFSNREKQYDYDFYDPNWEGISEGRDRSKYIEGIHEKLESLSDGANELWG
ncbi:unnamed protein product [marine sediment metagenome]|uniref:Uncharacterized protein n=1 Tax=marine sediment metagenome TaxID=412755 RepID=X1ICK0_9ZZZZ